MKQKFFIRGYYHVLVWSLIWAILNLVNAAGANIYRNAICDFYSISAAPLLDAATYGGWIGAFTFLVMPKVIQRFGAKNCMLVSLILGGAVFIMIPVTGNVLVMQLGIILTGVFAGIYGITTPMIMVSRWFPRHKGTVMGLISSGVIFATVLIIPVFNSLIIKTNVKTAMAIMGAGIIAFGVINLFLLKDSPEELGLLPDNEEMTEEERASLSVKGVPSMTMSGAYKNKRLWTMSLGWGLMLLAMIGFTFIGYSYLLERGVPQPKAIGVVGLSGIVACIGSMLMGLVDQKIGPVRTAIIDFVFLFTGMMIVMAYRGESMIITIIGYLIIQAFIGSVNSLCSSHNLSVFGPREYSVTFSAQTAVTSIIKMFGTFVAARSLIMVGNYSLAYKAFCLALVMGIILIVITGGKREEIK